MNKTSRVVFFLFLGGGILSFWSTFYTLYTYIHNRREHHSSQIEHGENDTNAMLTVLTEKISAVQKAYLAYAQEITSEQPSFEAIQKKLENFLTVYPYLASTGVAYAPFMHNKKDKMFGVECVKKVGKVEAVPFTEQTNYVQEEWFRSAHYAEFTWTASMLDPITKIFITRLAIPFYTYDSQDRRTKIGGVIFADITLEQLSEIIFSFKLTKTGYHVLTSYTGTLLVHPVSSYVKEQKTFADLGRMSNDPEYAHLMQDVMQKTSGITTLTIGDKPNIVLYHYVPDTDWYLYMFLEQSTTWLGSQELKRMVLHIIFSILALLLFCLLLIFRAHEGVLYRIWMSIVGFGFLCLVGITCLWTLDLLTEIPLLGNEYMAWNQTELDRFLNLHERLYPNIYKIPPLMIPTGMYITDIKVSSATTITLYGILWQKYVTAQRGTIQEGLFLLNADEEHFEKIYETTDNDMTTIGWKFIFTVRGNFNFTKYPFDKQIITLIMLHKEYEKNIFLRPDFPSFKNMSTLELPDLATDISIPEWTIQDSYYYYILTNYPTNFGIPQYIQQKNYPILHYSIDAIRRFIHPFTSSILPVIIIIIICFGILIIISTINSGETRSITPLISMASGIFFAAIVAHQTFIRSISASGITYFEYFYFVAYLIILLVTINGLLYELGVKMSFITYKNNLIPRVCYWPFVLSIYLGITIYFFY
ncbi:MAG TPA: hypothetical protein VEK38_01015 [Candidatus Bathyarchaeia archaeon]|nr:hypothetical protein [Candidatus Bathyarchaeia archaeon]